MSPLYFSYQHQFSFFCLKFPLFSCLSFLLLFPLPLQSSPFRSLSKHLLKKIINMSSPKRKKVNKKRKKNIPFHIWPAFYEPVCSLRAALCSRQRTLFREPLPSSPSTTLAFSSTALHSTCAAELSTNRGADSSSGGCDYRVIMDAVLRDIPPVTRTFMLGAVLTTGKIIFLILCKGKKNIALIHLLTYCDT